MGMKLVPSLGHGCADGTLQCNPAGLCPGETYRDLITNASSCTRGIVRAYAQDLVARYRNSSAVLLWELGNELNLAFDGCSYDKSDGAFFTAAEGLAFLREFAADVRAIDPLRPVNSGMGAPRLRAAHLALAPTGGRACVSPSNPKGDCDLECPAVAYDSLADTQAVLVSYYNGASSSGTDMVSAHWYSCAPPGGNYSWCVAAYAADNATTLPLTVFKAAADALALPLYVGEYGPDTALPGGWGQRVWQGPAAIVAMQGLGVQLSTLWAFECPSHDDMGGLCLHPGLPAANADSTYTLELLAGVDRALQGLPPPKLNLSLTMLPPPRPGASADAACLDGSPYGYYASVGASPDKWVVMLQGGGWCPDAYQCYLRTLPAYAGGGLGSSKYWEEWSWGWDFGPRFADWSILYLPYCDGASYSGLVYEPMPVPYGSNHGAGDSAAANGTLLYFRGATNMRAAVVHALDAFGVAGNISEILVTGGSAGGLSTTLHTDTLAGLMGAGAAAGVPQCGYFPYYNASCEGSSPSIFCNASDQFRHTVEMHNASGALAPQCLADHPGAEAWRCFMAPTATPYVAAPLFVWQSKFDHFQLSAFVDLDCMLAQAYNPPWVPNVTCSAHDSAATAAYGALFMQQFQPMLDAPGLRRGVFLTSCVLHGMDYHYLSVQQTSPAVAFNVWYAALRGSGDGPAVDNGFKWVEDDAMPRTDNPLACPPFDFTPPAAAGDAAGLRAAAWQWG